MLAENKEQAEAKADLDECIEKRKFEELDASLRNARQVRDSKGGMESADR